MARDPGVRPDRQGSKSVVVTVRFDPKSRYLAELAARRHRRPLSSYIEWAVAESFSRVDLKPHVLREAPVTLADEAEALWDFRPAYRVAKLAFRYPELLDHDEQVIWQLAIDCDALWYDMEEPYNSHLAQRISACFRYALFEKHFDLFGRIARGEEPVESLAVVAESARGA